jgi:hypothetical protein
MTPSTQDLAKLNRYHYKYDKYSNEDATRRINNKLKNSGYTLTKGKRGIAQYKHDSGFNVISVKGTDIKNHKDIISDVKLGLGMSKYDNQFKSRRNKIKDILKENKEDTYLTGHSLGASIITSSMSKSKSIRDNVKGVHNFNTGYSPMFNKELQKNLNTDDKKILNKKITHHHIKTDIISKSLTDNAVGKVKEYEKVSDNPITNHSISSFEN